MKSLPYERPKWEVADVIRAYGGSYLEYNDCALSSSQHQALRDLSRCRTAALGGHVEYCLDCGQERLCYNSCRNRHCPKCQALTRARWLEKQAEQLLPVDYYHVVFTLPAELSPVGLANPALVYDLLMRSAAATLRGVAADPKHLGAMIGVLMVLHTWGQNLHHHPHVHCVCTGGGLSCDRNGDMAMSPKWISCRSGFFLDVRVLSRVFRGKFMAGLRTALTDARLRLPGDLSELADLGGEWWTKLCDKDWVVYAKPPFGGAEQVLKYLARYTHRVAISNRRLLEVSDGKVSFGYKDYAAGGKQKTMTLSATEFLRRFLQHVLPKGFVKIRHYGLLSNARRAQRLEQCRKLLLVVNVAATVGVVAGEALEPAPRPCCPNCGSERLVYVPLPRPRAESTGLGPDSS